MKRYLSLLLALMLVLSLVPAIGVSAADANAIDPDLVTFEQYEDGTDLAGSFASNTIMATVSETFAKTGTKSAFLADTSTTSAALLRYQVKSAEVLRLEFDVRPTVGGGSFRFLNGVRGTANTAFWLQYVNRNVSGTYYTFLQYHDGTKWVDLHQFEGTLAGKWHNFVVEADVKGTAKIYVDNVYVGAAPRCDAGDYGDNATASLNAVVFECGAAATTSGSYYLDDLKLVPVEESFRENFESKDPAMAPGGSFDDPVMATVVEKANKDTGSTKALFLEDTSTTAAASVRAVVQDATGLNLSFKYLGVSGALQVHITNGVRNYANTAFWIQINGKNVQYYDGTAWQTIKTLDNFLTSWTDIRVEAGLSLAKIFVNNELVGYAQRAGGDFGTNVTNSINSVSFVCGAVATTVNKYYIDDVKLASLGGVNENFEDIELSGSADTLPGYVQSAATSVIIDPTDGTNNVLKMGDLSHSATPTFEYAYDLVSKYTLEMKVYIPNSSNTLTFQIHDGSEDDTTNTAYILSFNHAYGLRVLGGSYDNIESQIWEDLNTETRLTPAAWNTIRFEVNTEYDGEVVIYLNDELVGNTSVAYVKQDEVYGVQMSLGAATQSCYVDNIKMSPASYKQMVTPSVASDCESMEVGTVPGAPFVDAALATVATKAHDDATENKAIFLEDTSETGSAVVRTAIESSSSMVLDFNYLGWSGALQMQITSGSRSNANTAFFIQFSGKNVQYYDGSAWQTLKTRDVYFTSWTNIRVEADLEGAKIYVDDELMGTALRTGGSYGANVTDSIDSVSFAIGASAATGNKCYIDDVSLVGNTRVQVITPSFASDCEDMAVDTLAGAPFQNAIMANVVEKANTATKSTKAIFLEDTSTTAAAGVRASVEATTEMDIEFKYQAWSGALQMHITNGARSTANTAFWLQISGKNVQYYDGSAWQTFKVLDNFLSGWKTLRVVADLQTADLYLDGELLGTAQRAGGSYGSAVSDKIDSISFVIGAVAATGNKCYIDDVKITGVSYEVVVTPTPTLVDFETVNTSAAVVTEENLGAVVSPDPVYDGGKSLYLYDTENAKTPYINYTFESYDNLTVEYDVYVPDAKTVVSFQLYNGSKAYANTALWLQFNYAYGLRAYVDGAWQTPMNATAKLQPNEWNAVRLEMITGNAPYAVIYLNGEEVGTTRVAYSAQSFVNGLSIFPGTATQSCYLDNLSVSAASHEAPGTPGLAYNGNTISLTEDVTLDELTVESGMTLDLAGYTLNVGKLVAFGAVIDSSEDNSGLLAASDLLLNKIEYLPIAVDGGYKFYAYELKNLGTRANADGSVKYGFAIDFANTDAYALMAAGDCGVNVTMTLAWGEESQEFAFNADLVKQYAALQAKYPAVDAAMILTVTGLDALEAGAELSVTPAVNAAGVTATGDAMVYTID